MTVRFARRDLEFLLRGIAVLREQPDNAELRAEVRALGALIEIALREAFGVAMIDDRLDDDRLVVVEMALRSPRFVDAYPFDDKRWTRGMKIMASIVADHVGPKAYAVFAPRLSTKAVEHHVADGRKLLGIKPRRGRPRR